MPVRLVSGDPDRERTVAGRATLVIAGEPVEVEVVVQAGPATLEDVLPIIQGLSDLFVSQGAAKAEAEGRPVTCRAGCGACCRQLTPVSEAEAHALARLVAAMPEPRQSQVRARFEAALTALGPSGVLDRIAQPDGAGGRLGTDYFRLDVACPFLEDEACSIHPDRPLACREYLVTSPARACRALDPKGIAKVALGGEPSRALLAAAGGGWLPLVLALLYAEQSPAPPPERTGPDLLADIIGRL